MALTEAATLADLARVESKAELIGGRIVPLMPTGSNPGLIGFRIAQSLDTYVLQVGRGVAYPGNIGFTVPELRSGRQSFSPDAACFAGYVSPEWMRFVPGPPTLAVEVRSENDYGDAAEAAMAAKRADYFEAGTLVVWDVDPVAECVWVYRATAPGEPVRFGRGETADAEPAAPGWTLPVNHIFR
jgi:Uma2 family endonuclease